MELGPHSRDHYLGRLEVLVALLETEVGYHFLDLEAVVAVLVGQA